MQSTEKAGNFRASAIGSGCHRGGEHGRYWSVCRGPGHRDSGKYGIGDESRAGPDHAGALREGQMVHKGDPLLEIDPKPYQAALTECPGATGARPGCAERSED